MVTMRGYWKSTADKLRDVLEEVSPEGQWQEHNNYFMYRTIDGAVVNFWPSTGRFNLQGTQEAMTAMDKAMRSRSDPRLEIEEPVRESKRTVRALFRTNGD
jgi:hypothetical protein